VEKLNGGTVEGVWSLVVIIAWARVGGDLSWVASGDGRPLGKSSSIKGIWSFVVVITRGGVA